MAQEQPTALQSGSLFILYLVVFPTLWKGYENGRGAPTQTQYIVFALCLWLLTTPHMLDFYILLWYNIGNINHRRIFLLYKGIEALTKSLNQMANVTSGLYHDTFVSGIQTSIASATQGMTDALAQAIKPTVCDGISEAVANMGKIIHPLWQEQVFKNLQSPMIEAVQTLADSMAHSLKPEIYTGLSEAFESIRKSWQPTYLNMMNSICSDVCTGALSEIANSISVLTKGIPSLSDSIADAMKGIDWSSIKFDEDTARIEYDGISYTAEDIEKEAMQCQHELSDTGKTTNVSETLKKYKIISAVIAIVWFIISPILSNGCLTAWEENKFYIADALSKEEQIGFVIADETSVRTNNSSHSSEICKLLYGDGVVITDSIPYWYKVKFKDDAGNLVEGYVAKKNIEYRTLKFF